MRIGYADQYQILCEACITITSVLFYNLSCAPDSMLLMQDIAVYLGNTPMSMMMLPANPDANASTNHTRRTLDMLNVSNPTFSRGPTNSASIDHEVTNSTFFCVISGPR